MRTIVALALVGAGALSGPALAGPLPADQPYAAPFSGAFDAKAVKDAAAAARQHKDGADKFGRDLQTRSQADFTRWENLVLGAAGRDHVGLQYDEATKTVSVIPPGKRSPEPMDPGDPPRDFDLGGDVRVRVEYPKAGVLRYSFVAVVPPALDLLSPSKVTFTNTSKRDLVVLLRVDRGVRKFTDKEGNPLGAKAEALVQNEMVLLGGDVDEVLPRPKGEDRVALLYKLAPGAERKLEVPRAKNGKPLVEFHVHEVRADGTFRELMREPIPGGTDLRDKATFDFGKVRP